MKKIIATSALLYASLITFAQDRDALAQKVAEPLQQHTTRVVLFGDPHSYVLQNPEIRQESELITVQSGNKIVSVPLCDIRDVSLENYGVILSNRDQEVTFYMDLKHNPTLRERLREAFDEYLEERDTKRYTVRE